MGKITKILRPHDLKPLGIKSTADYLRSDFNDTFLTIWSNIVRKNKFKINE